jgi:mannose-6-phosphate isomerase-like protein (cupin superfamily)
MAASGSNAARGVRVTDLVFPAARRVRVAKRWGWEDWIWNCEQYCGKILFFEAGKRSSWHYHGRKDETFFVVSGRMTVTFGTEDSPEAAQSVTLEPGDAFHVPPGLRHRMSALEPTCVFEASTHHSEEDTHRLLVDD